MKLRSLKPFAKQYAKLPALVRKKFDRQLRYLAQDFRHPSIRAKKMVNRQDVWEGRVDYHYRFTFTVSSDTIVLRSVGTHAIYRKG